jgi:ATP-dependent DNA ligase
VAQLKFDGDRCVAAIEDGKVHLTNRHGKFHPSHQLSILRRELSVLNLPPGTHYLDGELLHPQIDQTMVLFDILQYKNYLVGWDQIKRLDLLREVCGNPQERCAIAMQVSPHVWLAERWSSKFPEIFSEFTSHDLIEGLVLRKADSILENWGSSEYEVSWQVRFRKPSKKYRY